MVVTYNNMEEIDTSIMSMGDLEKNGHVFIVDRDHVKMVTNKNKINIQDGKYIEFYENGKLISAIDKNTARDVFYLKIGWISSVILGIVSFAFYKK